MIDQNNWTKKKIPEPENSIKKIKWIQNPVVSIRCEKKTTNEYNKPPNLHDNLQCTTMFE